MRATRLIIYEGSEEWLIGQLKKSLPDDTYFWMGQIRITTIFDHDASNELKNSVKTIPDLQGDEE